ncbi:MAG: histidine--tRNA ligase [Mollicutes bacterium PWAP]|nr:histidine--tRNA ligase [Mollicutes bacterium PWAP]
MQKPKGTKDIFENRMYFRQYVEEILVSNAIRFGFYRIETPIFEKKEVFIRTIGEKSDIVNKEVYSFIDKGNREMILRPEGTAGTLRAFAENKLVQENGGNYKAFYYGPMFRYERPQRGRQRQFTQFGIEYISEKTLSNDLEVILLAANILDELNIKYDLVINNLADKKTRNEYSKVLKEYLKKYKNQLTKISIERLEKNPLRILDDKIDGLKEFVINAPRINDFYSEEQSAYLKDVEDSLKENNINVIINHSLVRGLDYYTDIAFEFVSTSEGVGSQSTIIGGGRYQNLLSVFGGPQKSGIGFAVGVERLVNEVEEDIVIKKPIDIFIANITKKSEKLILKLIFDLRKSGLIVEWNTKSTKLEKAFKKSDKFNSNATIVVGDKDLLNDKFQVRIGKEKKEMNSKQIIEKFSGMDVNYE